MNAPAQPSPVPGGSSMRLLTRSLLTVSVIALAAAVAWPQSLAEIAAREKERQEKVKKKTGGAAHVITEDDLRGRGAGTYSQPGAGSAADPFGQPVSRRVAGRREAQDRGRDPRRAGEGVAGAARALTGR